MTLPYDFDFLHLFAVALVFICGGSMGRFYGF
jgi:hypothetical protein